MKIDSIKEYCHSIFELLNVPMIIYHKTSGDIIEGYFSDASFSKLMLNDPKITNRYLGNNMFSSQHEVSFYISDDQIAFGSVSDKGSEYAIYIGPCLLADPSEAMMTSMLTRYNSPFCKNPTRYFDQIYSYIRTLPRFTLERFLWLLSFSTNYVNHDVIDPEDFYQSSIEKNRVDVYEARIKDETREEAYDEKDISNFIEELKSLLLNSSLERVLDFYEENEQAFFKNITASSNGIDPLRYSKNAFLLFIGELADTLQQKGISRKLTLSIINDLMKDCEGIIVLQQLNALYRKALTAFSELCTSVRIQKEDCSPLIRNAINYIHSHILEPVSAQDIADHIGISRGHLSKLFNEQMKMSISDYINSVKTETARSLLKNTDARIIDIANYLSFSSQSHFNNVFKHYCGVTPLTYRKNINHSDKD